MITYIAYHLNENRVKPLKVVIRQALAVLALILIAIAVLIAIAYAEAPEPQIKSQATNEITGEVSSLSPQENPEYIGISLGVTNGVGHSVYFLVDETIKVIHKKSLNDIKEGDRVSITYEETVWHTEEGKEKMRRIAKEIEYLKSAEKGLRSK